jgi:hypothetical protein
VALVVLTNAYILLNGTADISDHCAKVEFEVEAEEKDSTTFSSTGYKSVLGGLKSGQLSLSLKADYAAANLDSILWPLLGTVVAFDIKPVNAARSTSNPSYTGFVLVKQVKPIDGSVGDLADCDISWPTSSTVTRLTA